MSEELKEDLIGLGLQRYVSAIINAGYDDWEVVGDMMESDFDALNIRLGDRRKLQREIARRQLWPENSPLPTPEELRDFTLSLRDDTAEESKNNFQNHVLEALDSEVMSSNIAGSPAHDGSPFNVQDEGPGSIDETSQSSDTVPTLEPDAESNDEVYDITEESDYNHLSIAETDLDDDNTPRPLENRAVSPTSPKLRSAKAALSAFVDCELAPLRITAGLGNDLQWM